MTECFSGDRRLFLKGSAAAALGPWLAANLAAEEQPADKFYIQPYLQHPTADGMTICFAALDTSQATVKWGTDKDSLNRSAPMASLPISKVTWRVWKARLKGLDAKRTCFYRVDYDDAGVKKSSEVYQFAPFDPQSAKVRAAIYNDVHDRIPTAEALVRQVKPEDFDFTILLGDMWNDPQLANNARRSFENLEAYVRLFDGSNKPMLFVRGNHDVRGWFSKRLSHLFDLPLNDPTAEFADQNAYYDFRVGPVWFIAPDSGEDGSKRMETFQPYRQRQAEWLAKLMDKSPNRDAPWRVLTTHIPLYYLGHSDAAHSRQLWEPVLFHSKIDAAISGHIHRSGVIPKDEEVVYVKHKGKPDETTIRYTPPFPTMIGGGPGVNGATVMLISADEKHFSLRAINAHGEEVQHLALDKNLSPEPNA